MASRTRITTFGSAALFVIAGVLCGALVGGGTGQVLAFALIGVGVVLATGLVFMEVGLSEDRERSREAAVSERPQRPKRPKRLQHPRLGQSRGHRRRLQ